MKGAGTSWVRGRKGSVLLSPQQARVHRYLESLTTRGRIVLPVATMSAQTGIPASTLYRHIARLQALGVYGVRLDQGGARGGPMLWRTAIPHDGAALARGLHRRAVARIIAWARSRLPARLRSASPPGTPTHAQDGRLEGIPSGPPAGTFSELMRAAGILPWIAERPRP